MLCAWSINKGHIKLGKVVQPLYLLSWDFGLRLKVYQGMVIIDEGKGLDYQVWAPVIQG